MAGDAMGEFPDLSWSGTPLVDEAARAAEVDRGERKHALDGPWYDGPRSEPAVGAHDPSSLSDRGDVVSRGTIASIVYEVTEEFRRAHDFRLKRLESTVDQLRTNTLRAQATVARSSGTTNVVDRTALELAQWVLANHEACGEELVKRADAIVLGALGGDVVDAEMTSGERDDELPF